LKFILRIPGLAGLTRAMLSYDHPELGSDQFGLHFKNRVGLAAGFDKDARFIKELSCLGFGFVEIGTVTPKPQGGNPKPRLFRLKKDHSLINRMGFNNQGVTKVVERLRKRNKDLIIGGNIGKNKTTPNDEAVRDYELCFNALFDVVDYFVINVSSPNTPGLRELQEKEPLKRILGAIQERNQEKSVPKPLLVKISPDLTQPQLDDIVEIVQELELDGVIATNTTIYRENLDSDPEMIEKIGPGGLSGKVIGDRSNQVIKYINSRSGGTIPIIGVGGIFSAEDVQEKLEAGACLVQVYTGFIYEGPCMVKKILKQLVK